MASLGTATKVRPRASTATATSKVTTKISTAKAAAKKPAAKPTAAKPTAAKPTAAKPTAKAVKPTKPANVSTHPPKPRTPPILAVIDKVRSICMALPDTAEVVAWGEPTWRVGGKLFAMFDTHHHGHPHLSVWIAAEPETQSGLIEADCERFWRPPYVGHKGWVAIVVDDADPPWDMIGSLIADAHRLITPAPKRPRR